MSGINNISAYNPYSLSSYHHTNSALTTVPATTNTDDKVTLSSQQSYPEQAAVYRNPASTPVQAAEEPQQQSYLKQLTQAMLDQRQGFDREKWDELQEKIDAINAIENPTKTELAELESLQSAQQALLDKTTEKLRQEAEKKAVTA